MHASFIEQCSKGYHPNVIFTRASQYISTSQPSLIQLCNGRFLHCSVNKFFSFSAKNCLEYRPQSHFSIGDWMWTFSSNMCLLQGCIFYGHNRCIYVVILFLKRGWLHPGLTVVLSTFFDFFSFWCPNKATSVYSFLLFQEHTRWLHRTVVYKWTNIRWNDYKQHLWDFRAHLQNMLLSFYSPRLNPAMNQQYGRLHEYFLKLVF